MLQHNINASRVGLEELLGWLLQTYMPSDQPGLRVEQVVVGQEQEVQHTIF